MVPLLSLQQARSDASEEDTKKCGNCQIQNNHSRQEVFLTLLTHSLSLGRGVSNFGWEESLLILSYFFSFPSTLAGQKRNYSLLRLVVSEKRTFVMFCIPNLYCIVKVYIETQWSVVR